ncbi:hypothetical protein IKF63_02835 [Candidatus Saccharibacteria bacterium]|nr:hypothetical protein [Candidatus Saccharibacteria bacterium]
MKAKFLPFILFGIMSINVVKNTTIPVSAEGEEKTNLSEEKRGLISQNCGTIRQSLKNLQRADSRARIYFGSIYETVSSKYVTPLNLRLVKNNISSVPMINLQTSLANSRSKFSADFIDYSKSLEELIVLDCRLNPDSFYEKLLETRKKREFVASDMKTLNELLTSSFDSAEKIKEKIHD